MSDSEAHWRRVWTTKGSEQVSWFEADPATWLELIGAVAPAKDSTILDVGGGASLLVDRLLEQGYGRIIVADISEAALDVARMRLGARAAPVTWLVADARYLRLPDPVDLWHDRAVFHFLTDEADQGAYLVALRNTVKVGGHVVIATFGLDGPMTCSGLPVQRYDRAALSTRLGSDFQLIRSLDRRHVTPSGAEQPFTYVVLRREQ